LDLLHELPDHADEAVDAEDDAPPPAAVPDQLVYVIYTSGSTGRPKGVAMHRAAVANLLAWQEETIAGPARVLQLSSLSFDVSFQEIFSTWRSGGTLVLIDEETRRDPRALLAVIDRERVERVFFPFIALRQLAEAAADGAGSGASLRDLVTAGEQLQITGAVAEWLAKLPGCRLHNHYGPTETHVVTAWTAAGDPLRWPLLPPVGRPIAGARCDLLDRRGNPVALGTPGEVFLGGVAVARGYLGGPDLTAEKFVPDPFSGTPGARLYRTGDLARRRSDGEIDFLGRIDHQVKVRGYRIEPGEIEAALARHPAVRQAVVLVRESAGEKRLVACVAPEDGMGEAGPELAGELRAFLARQLPEPLVPADFVLAETFPLTPSGKVDRRALGRLAAQTVTAAAEYVAPRTPTEAVLASLWADLLGRQPVGIHDHFFALGGHSLMGVRLVSRVRHTLGIELPLRVLFEAPTIAALAGRIDDLAASTSFEEPPLLPTGSTVAPLSFAQERLWFLDRLQPDSAAYNLPAVLRLTGRLDVAALRSSFTEIVRRHGALRVNFTEIDGKPLQVVTPAAPVPLPVVDLSALPEPRHEEEAARQVGSEINRPFDLARGPLLRLLLLRHGQGDHVLIANVHHVASDGWSTGILVRESSALYHAFSQGQPSPLPELPIQFVDFALWQRRWLTGPVLAAQLDFWRSELTGAPA
ncbi:MAG TPA: amino acid adenylation domain-containing protein, partial [Thermoanaerobaculia bacterium]|nr:amino acid adenylation domain-containing protein [Thermoanaerobaculia bacterium]